MTASLFTVAPASTRTTTGRPEFETPELEFDWAFASGLPAEPERPTHLRLVEDPESATVNLDLPDPGSWAAMLACSLLETLSGDRPVGQLARWLAKDVHDELSARVDAARRHPAGRIRAVARRKVSGVRVCHVREGVVEACAVIVGNTRARSVAMRLEAVKGRWLATAVHLI